MCGDAPGAYYSAPSVPDVRFDDEESAFGAELAAPRRQSSDLPPGWENRRRPGRSSILGHPGTS